MNIKTGQIIKGQPMHLKFLRHYGIIIIEDNEAFVLHNEMQTGASIISLEEWLDTRNNSILYDSELMEKTTDEILTRFGVYCKKGYNMFQYNCEHFVDCMRSQPLRSEQLQRAAGGLLTLFFLLK